MDVDGERKRSRDERKEEKLIAFSPPLLFLAHGRYEGIFRVLYSLIKIAFESLCIGSTRGKEIVMSDCPPSGLGSSLTFFSLPVARVRVLEVYECYYAKTST